MHNVCILIFSNIISIYKVYIHYILYILLYIYIYITYTLAYI